MLLGAGALVVVVGGGLEVVVDEPVEPVELPVDVEPVPVLPELV